MSAYRLAPQFIFLSVLVVSRLLFHAMGLAPDPNIVVDHWQHIDLHLLASDPLGSLWNLHMQPPLWNGILSLAVALVGPNGDAVTAVMYGFNLALTAGAGLLIISLLSRFGFSPFAAAAFAALAICSPNILYFETYIFYPHFTFFLVTLLMWLLVQVRRDGPLWTVAGALGVLVMLSWTWAVFHPLFVALAGAALVVWRGGWTWRSATGPAAALALLATAIAALPTVKNLVTHGVPSASTWAGLNLAQTIPGGQTGDFVQCDFATAHRNAIAAGSALPTDHPVLTQEWKRPGAPNMNHAGMIAISRQCLRMTEAVMLHDPVAWLSDRVMALAGSHQLPPSSYDMRPLGWEAIFGPMEAATSSLGAAGRSAMTLWYLILLWVAVKNVRSNPPFYLSLLGTVVYFTLVTHLMNGGEQARMRYTIEPIYLFFSAILVLAASRRLARPWLGRPLQPAQLGE